MKKVIFAALGACVALAAMTSCGEDREGWTLKGNIAGADETTLYIEEPSGATWILVDSLKTDNNGAFEYVAVNPAVDSEQKIYRVRMGDRAVFFTVNGTETLTLDATAKDFGKVYRLNGNEAVRTFTTVDSLINAAIGRVGAANAVNDSALIADLGNLIARDTTCVASYYAVTRSIEGRPIFTTDNRRKVNIIGAVANKYDMYRANDARGRDIKATYLQAKKFVSPAAKGTSVEATMTGRPTVEFVRPDINGKLHDLNAVLDRGGVTVLNLSRYDAKGSALNTAALGQAYEKYKDRGLVIFQVGFEPNEALWRQNAARMPWTTVYNSPSDDASILMLYNADPVNGDPVSFVFNAEGEIVQRINNPSELEACLAKLF